ncbi:fibronectin type III domain-containing protein [Paenibacillus elgii]|uniref:fibronectin type III domain-containing protein n=1 Tax=Paenibacillus elgii TaxID=189691 RepID=UPI000248DC10|nr:chitinase N-terminal domain-containing protein [Paenibacillus elgii]
MKKIASLALLAALSVTSIVPAASAAEVSSHGNILSVAPSQASDVDSSTMVSELADSAKLVLTFDAVSGATGYRIRILEDGKEVVDTTRKSNSYTFKKGKLGTKYKVWVAALKGSTEIRMSSSNLYITLDEDGQEEYIPWK